MLIHVDDLIHITFDQRICSSSAIWHRYYQLQRFTNSKNTCDLKNAGFRDQFLRADATLHGFHHFVDAAHAQQA